MKTLSLRFTSLMKLSYYLFYPVGVWKIWKLNSRLLLKLAYTVLGLPLFLVLFSFFSLVVFASFLPPLDLSIGVRQDRVLFNSAGNYSINILKSGHDTNGAYELIQVELEPGGGNDWHYHKTFDEHFMVEEGSVEIGLEGKIIVLAKGEKITAPKNKMHYFKNNSSEMSVLKVRTDPARGLEKTIRVGYGLANDGLFNDDGFTRNPWHMALLMGYSESYLEGMPGLIQEPLVKSLAKIAQWKGEDKELEKYFR